MSHRSVQRFQFHPLYWKISLVLNRSITGHRSVISPCICLSWLSCGCFGMIDIWFTQFFCSMFYTASSFCLLTYTSICMVRQWLPPFNIIQGYYIYGSDSIYSYSSIHSYELLTVCRTPSLVPHSLGSSQSEHNAVTWYWIVVPQWTSLHGYIRGLNTGF